MPSESSLFLAGAVSGFAEAVVVQPFDMVKTRHQLNRSTNESVMNSLSSIYKEGGMTRFYRGFVAEVVGIVPKSSGMYASYEIARRRLSEIEGLGDCTLTNFIAGFISGVPEALIVTPTQVIKVRLQAKEHLGKYNGSVDCLQQVLRTEGIKALSIGLEPTLFRNCVWNTVYFGTMFWLKQKLPIPSSKPMEHLQTLVSGFFGAVFATCFNAPFDVVKSRFQSQIPIDYNIPGNTGKVLKYRNTIQSLLLIYQEEGLASCYKGFKPKAIRMGLGGGVAMMTFEVINNFMDTK